MSNVSLLTTEFILLGLVEMKSFKYIYFVIGLGIYLAMMLLSSMIVFIICTEPTLHEPMYILICNLIFNGMFGGTAFLPKLMIDLLSGTVTISLPRCIVQAFCIQSQGCVEMFTFAIMAHDRYLAVVHPLRYPTLMTKVRALQFIAAAWIFTIIFEVSVMTLAARLRMCGTNINNVYCETLSLLKLACGDTDVNNIFGSTVTLFIVILSEMVVIHSYLRIFIICLKISKDDCQKAIHTVMTHLIAFSIFICGVLFVAFRYRLNVGAMSHIVHLVLVVASLTISITINPILYGLRTEALRHKLIQYVPKIFISQRLDKPS
ncbi:olfactory receptor 5AC2-like [Pelodytes ibericus]